MKKNNWIVFVLCLFSALNAHDTYRQFYMPSADIQAVLDNAITVPVDDNVTLPADISYVCADIKYDNKLGMCVCETGDGIYMSFRAADIELNNHKHNIVSPYWGIFWNYLKRFNLPIWHVGSTGPQNAMAMQELYKVGARIASSLPTLEKDQLFRKLSAQSLKKMTNKISDYKGIIVYRAKTEETRDCALVAAFRKNYPQFLFVNGIAREHVKRKDNTYALFSAANLHDYIPRYKAYPTKYTPALAQEIMHDLGTDMFVLKPLFSSLSCGVNAIDSEGLDDLLKLIFHNKDAIKNNAHRSLSYWKKSKAPAFMATQYAPSKTIYKENKPYDPTMRIVFMMHHDNNMITITPIAGFWKIPVKSLNDDSSSLTERHVTIAHAGAYYSGIMIEREDWRDIENILHEILPPLYTTMLAQNTTKP